MLAYLDTSVVVAIRFSQPGAERFRDALTSFELYASPLLEAEWRSALRREQVAANLAAPELVPWVFQAVSYTHLTLPPRALG